ncbi:MAG TPA: hypothetical protein VHK67_06465 [Rhabdochlamydiaceae bacterium]|jgi:hypothetical protein|nr:hypothetical protein [Rhabdochlamydiaceae bacterium]
MKKTSMTMLGIALVFLTASANADRIAKVEITSTDTSINNRLYIGPEFMWSHFRGGLVTKSYDFRAKQDIYYAGLRFGYEYLKPRALYANTDAIVALGASHNHLIQEKKEIAADKDIAAHVKEAFKGHRGHLWINVEQDLGYTFASSIVPSCTISFYGAPGFHFEHIKGNKAQWWYVATGIKTYQQFTDSFHVGCDLKVMYAFAAQDEGILILPTTLGKKEFWGYEVGVPFEWALGNCHTFDLQFKPYLLKLNIDSPETILGARLELGYNF